jgi:formylglycine-generating enzyme required for sulfatase activity
MVAHHEVVDLSGGPFVMGSSSFENTTPHWVHLSAFHLGTTAVKEGQFREILAQRGNDETPEHHPVTHVSWNDARDYFLRINKRRKVQLGFPTEAEWEFGARGPAVNFLEVMEQEKVKPSDFVEFVDGRFENFVREMRMGAEIFTDPKNKRLRKSLREGQALYAWRVYGTPSGRLTKEEAWFGRKGTTSADWGPTNGYGLKGMTGGVWEWVGDWYSENYYQKSPDENPMGPEGGESRGLRGGSWFGNDDDILLTAYRINYHPGDIHRTFGFRVAAASQDSQPPT